MFLLNTLRNLLPFLFELEALVVVLNAPLMFVGIEFCLSWLSGGSGILALFSRESKLSRGHHCVTSESDGVHGHALGCGSLSEPIYKVKHACYKL